MIAGLKRTEKVRVKVKQMQDEDLRRKSLCVYEGKMDCPSLLDRAPYNVY